MMILITPQPAPITSEKREPSTKHVDPEAECKCGHHYKNHFKQNEVCGFRDCPCVKFAAAVQEASA